MKLNVDFNDELIKRYVKRGKSPVFTIYWTQDQIAYPEKNWQDFGAVVLSWWIAAAKSLLEGKCRLTSSSWMAPLVLFLNFQAICFT